MACCYASSAFILLLIGQAVAQPDSGNQQLWSAAKRGDAAAVEALLNSGVDVNARTPYGVTALHYGADKGHVEVVRVLIDRKADVNLKDAFYGSSPLSWAADKRQSVVVAALLSAKAQGAETILANAAARGQPDIVSIVLEKATLKPQDISQALLRTRADQAEVRSRLVQALQQSGDEGSDLALVAVARLRNAELVQSLINARQPTPEVVSRAIAATGSESSDAQRSLLGQLPKDGGPVVAMTLLAAVRREQTEVVRTICASYKPRQETLDQALSDAHEEQIEIVQLLQAAGAQGQPQPAVRIDSVTLHSYAGNYANEYGGELQIAVVGGKLTQKAGEQAVVLRAMDQHRFHPVGNELLQYTFQTEADKVAGLEWKPAQGNPILYRRAKASQPPPTIDPATLDFPAPIEITESKNWPSFRGSNASGVADGQWPPVVWDVEKSINIRWKTPIPGLAHSCPIVWGDRVYVTSAVRLAGNADLKIGLYGDVQSVEDTSEHAWTTYCLNKQSGSILWQQVAHQGVPRIKRHTKGSHANCTAATNGKQVVVNFASEGLYCYDCDGHLQWKRELGTLDSGWFFDSDYQWGFGSSPIIHGHLAIVQCDIGPGSYIAAYRLQDGSEAWRTSREEIPSWGTPTIVENPEGVQLVTNATKFARGYDPLTGTELWRLGPHSEITVPTPVCAEGLIILCSGYRPIQPIYAIRLGARGDISLTDGQTASDSIAWSTKTGGTYMPTPIIYAGYLYFCSNSGIITCYQAKTGQVVYKQRLPGGGSYTASPVAADGNIYFTSEEGRVRVISAGPDFTLLADNNLGEPCLATPAISDGMLLLRTQSHLISAGRNPMPRLP